MLFFSLAVRLTPKWIILADKSALNGMPVVFYDVGRIVISFLAIFTMFMNANSSITLPIGLHSDRKADRIIEASRDSDTFAGIPPYCLVYPRHKTIIAKWFSY